LVETIALRSVTAPSAPFCAEPIELVRDMEDGVRLWRAAIASTVTGAALVHLLVRKHVFSFKNVRAAGVDNQVSVYHGRGVWKTIPIKAMAIAMLSRSESDLGALCELDCGTYSRFRPQMLAYAAKMGARLGWAGADGGSRAVSDFAAVRALLEADVSAALKEATSSSEQSRDAGAPEGP
jgi:hypothetical protein